MGLFQANNNSRTCFEAKLKNYNTQKSVERKVY